MTILKQLLSYFFWTVLALLLGMRHMRIVLGPNNVPTNAFSYLLHCIYNSGLFYIGLIIGSIIALLFIIIDVFYLKKKLKNNIKSTLIRFFLLLTITGVVGVTHYILEKVIDVI